MHVCMCFLVKLIFQLFLLHVLQYNPWSFQNKFGRMPHVHLTQKSPYMCIINLHFPLIIGTETTL
jgi:hypothetical protein